MQVLLKSRNFSWSFCILVLTFTAIFTGFRSDAGTVAYWRFEAGPAFSEVPHTGADGAFTASVLDVSGNGNHLSPWTAGGYAGFAYRSDVPYKGRVPLTGETNLFSVKNTGAYPAMFTAAAGSAPTGINAETMTPAQFTIEASYKPEANGAFRTIVGRDARNVASSNGDLAALYLQVQPDDRVGLTFVDVAGYVHSAFSPPGWLYGFNFGTDPEGSPITPWYNIAATSDGKVLKVYVNQVLVATNDLVASGSPNTALARGATSGADYRAGAWSVGRGLYAGNHTDRAYGFIDEVRISDVALEPWQQLSGNAPEIKVTGSTPYVVWLKVSGGLPGSSCSVLQSSDPAAPVSQWSVYTSRTFDANGEAVGISVDPASPAKFFAVKSTWKQPVTGGAMTWQLAGGSGNWPADIRAQIIDSMNGAVALYNRYGTFRKALTANYNPGVPTAQANYDGWIDFGNSRNFRVALHEISHTLGVGTYWGWSGMLQNGVWTGANGVAMVRAFDGPTGSIHSDGTHFWPYGLNYDNEGGTENFRRHVLMVDAFRKDLGIQ